MSNCCYWAAQLADRLKMLERTLMLKHLLTLRETASPQQLAVAASAQQRVGHVQVPVVADE